MCYHITNNTPILYCAYHRKRQFSLVLHKMDDIDTSNWPVMPQQQRDRMLLAVRCLHEYKALSAAEYVDHVSSSLRKLNKTRDGRRLQAAKRLLHDKCTAHTAKLAKKQLPKLIQVLQLPTDSPDLTPCDTSFFAAVKGRWQRELARQPRPWAESCQLALEIISTTSPDKYIKAMPLRWQACINVEGWHIEQEYKLLKAAKKAG